MIMRWKQEGSDYTTTWQHIQFLLTEDPTTKRWNLYSNGRRVRQTWPKARIAMEQIDNRQQSLVLQAAASYAEQVPTSRVNGGLHGRFDA